MPYHIPQIPAPAPVIPSRPPANPNIDDATPSTSRIVLGVLAYPIYLIIAILATPLPILLNGFRLLYLVLSTILYPFTAVIILLTRAFILAPISVVSPFIIYVSSTLYPIVGWTAGVIGVGCAMGAGAGYLGKAGFDRLFRKTKSRSTRHKKPRSSASRKSSTLIDYGEEGDGGKQSHLKSPSSGSSIDPVPDTPIAAVLPKLFLGSGSVTDKAKMKSRPRMSESEMKRREETGEYGGRHRMLTGETEEREGQGMITGVRKRTNHLVR
ncbi:MAG: hypothetical protein TREMPRED_003837 [Tremellales sp. Tagirdzhanova-0007]|nr:MAG: hypothetical protein TREMPRED_003837 [Tremellales sp. Tagirdzhanova-0007]